MMEPAFVRREAFEALREALNRGIKAIELLSTVFHDMEARGVQFSSVHDQRWGAATGVCEEMKRALALADKPEPGETT